MAGSSGGDSGTRFRGQPLMLLLLLIGGWIAFRIATFRPMLFDPGLRIAALSRSQSPAERVPAPAGAPGSMQGKPGGNWPVARAGFEREVGLVPSPPAPAMQQARPVRGSLPGPVAPNRTLEGREVAVGQHVARAAPAAPLPVSRSRTVANRSRWSADGWLLWRRDNSSPLLTGRPAYGRSQAGAVLRFDLARAGGHRAQAYLRGSAALAGAREKEVAVGLSARPLAIVPLRLAAEARVSETDAGRKLRPTVFVVTEIPPLALSGRARAEAYAQAGYVGGAFATAFVDGQLRVDRSLVSLGGLEFRAGAGSWGGAQKHAGRLDVGPSASVSFGLGMARARLTADYRLRVAGNARPTSGPALTLSAGF